jgi:glycosyltransferase involved in cell wall biosynthesis
MSRSFAQPEISVIMPCYNAERYIEESVGSILNQSFTNFELILINDGSADNTLRIINQYALADDRVVVIDKQNTGQTDSMNVGINRARGRLIARLDNDDLAAPNRLAEQQAFLNKNSDVVLLGTCAYEIDAKGAIIRPGNYPKNKKLYNNLRKMKRFFPHSSAMFRLSMFKLMGGYNQRFKIAQDYDLWLRFAEKGRISCLKDRLVKIRIHENNYSNVYDVNRKMIIEAVAATVSHFIRSKNLTDPSSCQAADHEWQCYYEWIKFKTEASGFISRLSNWSHIRDRYYSGKNKIYQLSDLLWGIAKFKDMLPIISEKIWGSKLPRKLAEEWMKRNNPVKLP